MKTVKIFLTLVYVLLLGGAAFCQPEHLTLNSYTGQPSIRALKSITLTNGFHITTGSNVLISVGGFPQLSSAPSAGQNYVLTRTFREPVKAANLNDARTIGEENQTIQYFDGLGRPLQTVELMASPSYKDIVQHTEYDGFGREAVNYLPYAEQNGANGSYKAAAKTSQAAYYAAGSWDGAVVRTPTPFAVTVFENSPLNRVLQQGAPGEAWQPAANRNAVATTSTSGHTIVTDYGSNAQGEVRLWEMNTADNGANGSGYYLPGKLYKTVVKDENWTAAAGKAGTEEEFKDFEGRVVLKRVWETDAKALNTYYVYDDFGDLRYVVPPGFTTTNFVEATSGDFDKFLYAYRYDARRRLVEKKIPGKGWEYFVYNNNDLEVLRQDAAQRITGSWTYSKYDVFGRLAYSGIYSAPGLASQTAAQQQADNYTVGNVKYLWEDRTGRKDYTDRSFPKVNNVSTAHITNYYDDYTFRGADTAALQPMNVTVDLNVKTLITGVRITDVDGSAALLTINYYDRRGQMIQSASQNQVGGTDFVTNTYNFPGKALTSKREHRSDIAGNVKNLTILTSYEYDHNGRLKETKKKIDNQAEILQSALAYNEIGQLVSKDLHGAGDVAAQRIAFSYNERGWTAAVNDPATLSNKRRFGLKLDYANNPRAFNGNIGSLSWNTMVGSGQTQTPLQGYLYTYDALNRLKKASYTSAGRNGFFNEELAYDNMGNIDSLRRTNGSNVWYNHFKYSYNGNQLSAISDVGSAARSNSFAYDANGNGRTNSRLGITDIRYDYLNLPKQFIRTGQALSYSYDATGAKRSKTFNTAVTHYVDGIQYANGTLAFIQTEEGRILPSGSSFIYEYFLTDHLGNTRAVVDHTGALKQLQDYFPFGMEMNTGAGLNSGSNQYKYNGQEKQSELGLDQLDYGARFYDPEIGRWNVIDPMAETHYNVGSYGYVLNNPILYGDLLGLDTTVTYNDNRFTVTEWQDFDTENSAVGLAEVEVTRPSGSDENMFSRAWSAIGNAGSDHPYFGRRSYDVVQYYQQINAARDPLVDLAHVASLASGVGDAYLLARGGIFLAKAGIPLIVRRLALRNAAKGGKSLLSAGQLARIENAATRIGKPINVVGSRASGKAQATSDWDYVIEGLTNKQWKQIKNSLPGAPSRIDNLPRMIDIFEGPVDITKPFITIFPK